MIVRVKTGTSFKGAGLYLLHDKRQAGEAERLTTERVPWTYALNTLEQEPEQVIAEMQQTCLNQPMLKLLTAREGKRDAGDVGGRPLEKPVMTVSLSWSPDQVQPSKGEMIRAAENYLDAMGWNTLQVLMMPHTDEAHQHIHLLINRVDPYTGATQDDAWRNHRSLQWAREYDAREGFYIEQREAKYERGEKVRGEMTRSEWEAWKAAGGTRRSGTDYDAARKSGEWDALKTAQQDERRAFFKDTHHMRADLRDLVRDTVKAEFADRWQEYARERDRQQLQQKLADREARRQMAYLRQHGGGASSAGIARLEQQREAQHASMRAELAELRMPITEAQSARLKVLAEPAIAKLEKERATAYEALKADHRAEKKELRQDQETATHRPDLLQRQHDAAGKLAEASVPRATPEAAPPLAPPHRHPYRTSLRQPGVSQTEALRRAHAHGTGPVFPADRPQPATRRPERTAADRMANAGQEVTQPAASIDMANFMASRATARAVEVQTARAAPRGEVTDRKQRRANDEERRPKSDAEALIRASRAQDARSADRGRGEDDSGRDR